MVHLKKKPLKKHWLRWYLAKKPLPFHRGQKLTIVMLYRTLDEDWTGNKLLSSWSFHQHPQHLISTWENQKSLCIQRYYRTVLLVAKLGLDKSRSFSPFQIHHINTKYRDWINSKYKIHCGEIRPRHKPIIQSAVIGPPANPLIASKANCGILKFCVLVKQISNIQRFMISDLPIFSLSRSSLDYTVDTRLARFASNKDMIPI